MNGDLFRFASDGAAEAPTATASSIWAPEVPAQVEREEQAKQIRRVESSLTPHIATYLRAQLATKGGRFTGSDLELHCSSKAGSTLGSATRILRLGSGTRWRYEVVSRRGSAYRVTEVIDGP